MANSEPVVIASDQSAVPVSGTVTANLSATDNAVLDAIEVDTTTIAGSVYTEGDTDVSITGTPVLWEGLGNTLKTASHETPLPVDAHFDPGSVDSFGHFITGAINNQVDIQFYRGNGTVGDLVTETNANGGTATATGGMATFAATTTANSSAKGVTTTTTVYTAGAELYTLFTAGWTGTGAGTSYQRIGLYDDNNGFFISKEANSFGVTIRKGGSDTFTAKASFSEDTLVGGTGSFFTRDFVPEAIDLTKLNVFRIRFGWVGSAPISFEVLAPDGNWVTFHKILQPNLTALPSIEDADLPVTCDVNSGNSGAALTLITNCWAAGTTQSLSRMDATVTDATIAQLTRSVITGETTAGGGAYVNVKVSPSGALEANVSATDLDIRNLVFATDKVDASGTVLGAGTNNIGDVDVLTINGVAPAFGTGARGATVQRVTIATDDSVPVTNAGITTIAGAVSGTEMQVDVLTMPTTTVTATDLDIRDLTQASDSILIYGSDDGGTTKRVIKTDAGGAIQVDLEVASVAVTSIAAGDNNIGNVDIVSSALPTGASTLAEQQSQTTHLSTIAGDTTSIQTAVELIDDTVYTDGSGTVTKGIAILGQDGTNPQAIKTDASGELQVDVLTMPTVTIQDGGNTITVDGSVGITGSVTVQDGGGSLTVDNNGTFAVQASLNAGTNNIGDVDILSIAAGTNKIGDVDISPRTTGGWSVANFNTGDTFTALTNTAQVIKASAGKFGGYYIYNPNSSATYVMLYNVAAASVTVGTTTPAMVFCIPATAGANLELIAGIPFSNAGWSIAAATTGGGNTAPATALEAMIFYV